MSKPVRVRFAPSPTGPLHIGGVRTALFNYLFAKKNNGIFFLRIEDTDQNRLVKEAEKYIFDSLEWLGISPDETINKNEKFGPYRQSERISLYKKYAEILINSGNAYYAFDTKESLEKLRIQEEKSGKTFIYNYCNREKLDNSLNKSHSNIMSRIANGDNYVIRFKTPTETTLHLKDIIRGDLKFKTNFLDDKVLFKSDHMPTYHLANVVDDYLMRTSHIIRGEEWLPSMPLHVMLYNSFGWEVPEFAHLPLILNPQGKGKLSKRDGEKLGFPVIPIQWNIGQNKVKGYKEAGYFPEAVVNFLALLGWNDGTEQEIFSVDELIMKFDLYKINKSGAKFDSEKNKWFNHQYLIKENNEKLTNIFLPILKEKKIDQHFSFEKIEKIISLVKDRTDLISEFWELSYYFFEAPTKYNDRASKNWSSTTSKLMHELINIVQNIEKFTKSNIELIVKNWINLNEIGFGFIMQPLRLSLVGELKGVDVFDIIEIIGKDETLSRIKTAIIKLQI